MTKLPNKQKGSVAVEYMILTVFIGLTIASGATFLGHALNNQMRHTATTIENMGESPSRIAANG